MYQYQGYDPMTGVYLLIALATLAGLLVGVGLGYRLAWRHQRVEREYAQREPDVQTESKALEAYEAAKLSEAWIDRLEQEVLGHE